MSDLAATIVECVTAVTCGSLWLASVIDKRLRAETAKGDEPDVGLLPFRLIHQETPCFICGDASRDKSTGLRFVPLLCKDKKCVAAAKQHLHVKCESCGGVTFMATRSLTTTNAK